MQHLASPEGHWEVATALPHARLRPGVQQYRGFRLDLGLPRQRLEVPDGVVTLVFSFDHELRVTEAATPSAPGSAHRSMLVGLRTTAGLGRHSGRLYGLEVILTPWKGYSLFGIPMHELADTIADPIDLLGPRCRDLADALACAPGWAQRFDLLDATFLRWSADAVPASARVQYAWRELARTSGALPIGQLVAATGWGWRQLENRFRAEIGLTPKGAARVMRLRKVLRLMAENRPVAGIAAECGFSDQAHLNREFKAMIGRTPRQFRTARALDFTGPPTVDRVDGQVTSVVLS
ncbi:AraC family transcriptional regulator [Streptomyces sp. H39-S7]|uniref:AraC family transcriptional regulator n=1 Tax=Streptomyces sp. H39-S7 TaxID=3004357 RepID=UPI0022B0615E|nr:helix-turn-helix domain-containing protein [Streptomyces sp. H39-S7]MCZ4121670.1 helix-turn-helix domain-containing protein [Streptomyces sp. H39-S7]